MNRRTVDFLRVDISLRYSSISFQLGKENDVKRERKKKCNEKKKRKERQKKTKTDDRPSLGRSISRTQCGSIKNRIESNPIRLDGIEFGVEAIDGSVGSTGRFRRFLLGFSTGFFFFFFFKKDGTKADSIERSILSIDLSR